MEIALIADIHGNAVALDTVVAELEAERPDEILCLGDVAEGPQPNESIALIRSLECQIVRGNADEDLLSSGPPPDDDVARKFYDINEWSTERLDERQLDFVGTFESTLEIALTDDVRLFACHGSPESTTDGIEMTMDEDELDGRFGSVDADVIGVGHTHTQFFRRYRSRPLINPGSVGLPYIEDETGAVRNPPWAEYAILSYSGGRLGVELRRTPVDVDAIIDAIETSGMPHSNWWADEWRKST